MWLRGWKQPSSHLSFVGARLDHDCRQSHQQVDWQEFISRPLGMEITEYIEWYKRTGRIDISGHSSEECVDIRVFGR